MNAFLTQGRNFEHALALLILIGRVGDIGSTYLVTPTLKLEANPFVRRARWPVGFLSLGLCLVPYYSTALAVLVLVPSLLVSANNLARGWVARAVGEDEFLAFLHRAARRTPPFVAVAFTAGAGAFVILAGLVLLVLSGGQETWAFWFALGIILYGIVIGLYGSLFAIRVRRQSVVAPATSGVA
jgi:hypothetical protein